jgi:hypothetical protein
MDPLIVRRSERRIMAAQDRMDEVHVLLQKSLENDGRFVNRAKAGDWITQLSKQKPEADQAPSGE